MRATQRGWERPLSGRVDGDFGITVHLNEEKGYYDVRMTLAEMTNFRHRRRSHGRFKYKKGRSVGDAGSEREISSTTKDAANHAKDAAVHTAEAAAGTQHAAHQTAAAARSAKSSAERTTELAADRTVLAFERTYAAWVRTGLVALASGVGARKLLDGVLPAWMTKGTGLILLLFSAFCFCAAVWRHLFRVQQPTPETHRLPGVVLIVVSVSLALVALAAFVGISVTG